MDLNIRGINVSVSDRAIEQLLLQRFTSDKVALVPLAGVLPRIGAEIVEMGGIFAGVMRGRDGAPDYYLIVGPESPSKLTWQAGIDWADGVSQHGFDDFELPYRKEQALCFANVPELFKTDDWYWSQEQHAGSSSYAWGQHFGYGYQGGLGKGYGCRCRAVRRLPIQ